MIREAVRWLRESLGGSTPHEAAYAEDVERHREKSREVMEDVSQQVRAIQDAAAVNRALAKKSKHAAHQMLRRLQEDFPE